MLKVNRLGGSGAPRRSDLKPNEFEMSVVTDDHCRLTDSQKFLVRFFESKTGGERMACRGDFDPMEITKYLPYITLFELDIDDEGKINDVKARLFGTALADFYGEWTGQRLQDVGREDSLKQVYPETYNRLFAMANLVLKERKPITLLCEQVSEDRSYWQIRHLVVPFSRNGTEIGMLFMYTELTNKLILSS